MTIPSSAVISRWLPTRTAMLADHRSCTALACIVRTHWRACHCNPESPSESSVHDRGALVSDLAH